MKKILTNGNFRSDRRSFMLKTGALGTAAALGLHSLPIYAQTPKSGGVLRIGMSDSSTEDSLDPQRVDSKFELNLNWQLRNNLIEVGPGGVLVPELATEWNSKNNATEWVFKLRNGVEFHNGKSLDAEDVVYSLNLHRGEKTTSISAALMNTVTDVTVSAPNEVTVKLDAPNSSLSSLMTIANFTIVPAGETDFQAGVGTGAYILESNNPGVKSRVTRNPNYWKQGRAHFDAVETIAISDVTARTSALRSGEIDAMNSVEPHTAQRLSSIEGIDLLQTQGKVHNCFTMLTTQAPFNDPRVRKAMKLSINRQEIVDKILAGYGSIANDQPISSAYQFHNPSIEQRQYDPEQARSLLKAAGFEGLSVNLHASNTPFLGAVDAGQLYSEQAARAGINIENVREPEDGYWANVWGKKPFFASRWSGRPNEDLMLTVAYSKASIGNYNASQWDNDAFNKALIAARGETDEQRRKELYWECQSILHDDSGLIAPVWADFLDAKTSQIQTGEISSEWDLDGGRAAERWWMA